jgi:hypothetical protein
MDDFNMNRSELWQKTIGFYRELIEEYGWEQQPMLELVLWLAVSEHCDDVYPSTSHRILCLAVATYPKLYEMPIVSVVYDNRNEKFIIKYTNQSGELLSEQQMLLEQARVELSRLLVRLKVESEI